MKHWVSCLIYYIYGTTEVSVHQWITSLLWKPTFWWKRKIKQSVVKWIESNCAFLIINFIFLILWSFHHYSLLYIIIIIFFTLDFFRYTRAYRTRLPGRICFCELNIFDLWYPPQNTKGLSIGLLNVNMKNFFFPVYKPVSCWIW